jgi:hypothetical protein
MVTATSYWHCNKNANVAAAIYAPLHSENGPNNWSL